MSSPQARQCDSINFPEYGLAFRIEDGLVEAIFPFDAALKAETQEIMRARQMRPASKLRGF